MIKNIFTVLTFILLATFVISPLSLAAGAEELKPCTNADSTLCQSTETSLIGGILTSVINLLLVVAGVIAVIMVIVGGIRYITSDGDSGKANQAKNTILYAVIGVVVTVMSYSIVNFVIGRL